MLFPFAFIGPETAGLVFLVVLVLFGGKKIPELMRGVGQGIGQLRKGMEEGQKTLLEVSDPHEDIKPVERVATPVVASEATTVGSVGSTVK